MILIFDLVISILVGAMWFCVILITGLPLSFALIVGILAAVTGMFFLPLVQGGNKDLK